MQPDDLELCTTEQLVEELMRRQTFLGVLIHSEQDWKDHWVGSRNFKVRFKDLIEMMVRSDEADVRATLTGRAPQN